jgi:uncharacterized membrane protein HdeD (DUF308 family)
MREKPKFAWFGLVQFIIGMAVVAVAAFYYFTSPWAAAACVALVLALSACTYILVKRLVARQNAGP